MSVHASLLTKCLSQLMWQVDGSDITTVHATGSKADPNQWPGLLNWVSCAKSLFQCRFWAMSSVLKLRMAKVRYNRAGSAWRCGGERIFPTNTPCPSPLSRSVLSHPQEPAFTDSMFVEKSGVVCKDSFWDPGWRTSLRPMSYTGNIWPFKSLVLFQQHTSGSNFHQFFFQK